MKTRFFLYLSPSILLKTSLLAVILAACAPASTPTQLPATVTEPPAAVLPTVTTAPALETATEGVSATEASDPTPLPVVTSRGPELEATDPTTVSLASGDLQFVEFFRFT